MSETTRNTQIYKILVIFETRKPRGMKNILMCLIIVVIISSCATRKDKAVKFMHENTDVLSELCAAHFKPIIEYKPGVTIHKTDTQYVEGEPIPCPPNEAGEVVYVRGRDKVIRDTVWRTDTATVRDIAKEAVLSGQVQELRDSVNIYRHDRQNARKSRNTAWMILGGIGVLGVGAVALKLKGWI